MRKTAAWMISLVLAFPLEFTQAQSSPSWLHPSDAEYRQAIDDGYALKVILEAQPTLRLKDIQPESDAEISLQSPVNCATLLGFVSASKLRDKPSLAVVRGACDGKIRIAVSHFSKSLENNWPVILKHGTTVLQPADHHYDRPDVRTYRDTVGYSYFDQYTFKLPEAWTDEVTVTWADDHGARHSKTADFSVFVKEERAKAQRNP